MEGMTFVRRYSISMGFPRPESCSSSMQSSTDSDCEPTAARAASRGRHLRNSSAMREGPYNVVTNFVVQPHEHGEMFE